MPVEFLTSEQEQSYGRYHSAPSPAQLARYFYLSDTDKKLIAQRRGEMNRLGFAIQLSTVRFIGTFLHNPTDVPDIVVDYLAKQLDIANKDGLSGYGTGRTHWDHTAEIKRFYGFADFSQPSEYFRLIRWLYTRTWISSERPSVLFDLATARLVERKVLLPGVTVLARLISRVRSRVASRLWRNLANKVKVPQRPQLEALLVAPDETHQTDLDRLRRAPTRISGPALVNALLRLKEFQALSVGKLSLAGIPASRISALARHAATVRAQAIARMPENRRIATLLAFAREFELKAMDDVLDLFDLLMAQILKDAKNTGEKERIRTLHDLDAAALQLALACEFLFDEGVDSAGVRCAIFDQIPKMELLSAVTTVKALARPADDNYYPELIKKYLSVRRFLPTFLDTVTFSGTQAAGPVLEALQFLISIEGQRKPSMSVAPLAVISYAWLKQVINDEGRVDRRAYTLCALEHLQESLRRRDIFVEKSNRWGDPGSKLLSAKEWEAARGKVCHALGRHVQAKEQLTSLSDELDSAFRRTAENFPLNAAVTISNESGRDEITLTGLDKLDEPPSLIRLRDKVNALLPLVDLPQVLLEIQARTGFADEFTHISEAQARVKDFPISICASLLAEACNIGIHYRTVFRPYSKLSIHAGFRISQPITD